jgi:bis(5'-adenosyl)-triphosphatase
MDSRRLEDCRFCSESRLAAEFAASASFRAVCNLAPILPGHSLITPKHHIESLLELSDAELCELMIFSRSMVRLLLRAFNAEAFNWTIQEGAAAGQTVSHLHLHLIPRESGDLKRPGDWYPLLRQSEPQLLDSTSRNRLTPAEIKQIVSYFKGVMAELED